MDKELSYGRWSIGKSHIRLSAVPFYFSYALSLKEKWWKVNNAQ